MQLTATVPIGFVKIKAQKGWEKCEGEKRVQRRMKAEKKTENALCNQDFYRLWNWSEQW
jgi:hypothetical protein